MDFQTLIARVLIVEDDEYQVRGIKSDLDNIPSEEKKRLGISRFESEEAGSATDAKQLLAKAEKKPYDLLLLDLNLPKNKGDREESIENGFKVLDFVRKFGGAKEAIVVSGFPEYRNLTRAFRGGALDFIAKPFTRENLQTRALECWKRVLAKDSGRFLEQRIKELIPLSNKGLAHQFSACFSRFIQAVVHKTEEIESELGERLGLEARREPQDSLIRHLRSLEEAVREAKREWTGLYASLSGGDEMPKEYVVEELLCKIAGELLPCLKVKGVEMEFPLNQKTGILSFQDDVRAVLKEILSGALSELSDYSDPSFKIEITVTQAREHAQVRFSGDLFRINPEVAAAIEKGERQSDGRFSQVWGLSVAQYIALRGGGRLQIGAQENPNSVTYLIPLARHA